MSAFDDWLDSFPEKESEDLEDECTYQAAKIVFNAGLEAGKAERDKPGIWLEAVDWDDLNIRERYIVFDHRQNAHNYRKGAESITQGINGQCYRLPEEEE